jgi:DUF971 family protein
VTAFAVSSRCGSCATRALAPAATKNAPFRVLSEKEMQAGSPMPVAMPARGAYAYQIVWNDGHDTGIYKLELLRELCEPTQENR